VLGHSRGKVLPVWAQCLGSFLAATKVLIFAALRVEPEQPVDRAEWLLPSSRTKQLARIGRQPQSNLVLQGVRTRQVARLSAYSPESRLSLHGR